MPFVNETDTAEDVVRNPPRKPLYRRRWVWVTAGLVAIFVACVGPWPVTWATYEGASYARATFDRVEATEFPTIRGSLRAGIAVRDITPAAGEPMAGYGARKPKTSEAVDEPVFAKAVSLCVEPPGGGPSRTVTIVGGDILLFLPELRAAVLDRAELPPEDVFFTSTHTHSGPGGFSSKWVEELVLGDFDRGVLDRMAGAFADVIRESRASLRPARVDIRHVRPTQEQARRFAVNRYGADQPVAGNITEITLLPDAPREGRPLATLVIANAHPTCLGSDNRRIGGDYPGRLQRRVEESSGGMCMFIAGGVGSTGPATHHPRGPVRLADVADGIFDAIRPAATSPATAGATGPSIRCGTGRFEQQAAISADIVTVDLPPRQYRISENLRLSPVAAGYLHGRSTYVHVLRINGLVLLGMPGDYSGELGARLVDQTRQTGLTPVIVSFNGDYIGYILPVSRYTTPTHETRDENLFGPWCGEYFNDIAGRIVGRLAAR